MSAVTKHARQRGRERFRLKLTSMIALAAMALEKGIRVEETAGRLRNYLDGRQSEHPGTMIRLYAEKVLIYGEQDMLITAYPLPNEFKGTLKKIREAKRAA